MNAATTARPARWPWVVLAATISVATVGLVFVSLNEDSLIADATNFSAFMGMGVVGALSLSRSPTNRIGMLLLSVATCIGVAFASSEAAIYVADRGNLSLASWIMWPGNTLWAIGFFALLILLPLLYPDGRLPSRRWRYLLWAGLAVCVQGFVSIGFGSRTFVLTEDAAGEIRVSNPLHVPALGWTAGIEDTIWPVLLSLFGLSVASMVIRFRRSKGIERQQLKWFAFAVVALVAYFIASAIVAALGISEGSWGEVLSGLAFLGLPVAVGMSILQYRLWDLDVVVRKAVVAGTLVFVAILVYAATVALIGAVVDTDRPAVLFAIALALGIAFRPVTRVARRVADRVVYGRRATPYEVLTEFSERLGTSYGTEDVLPRMAQVLGDGTGAEVARVWLRSGRELHQAAVWPADAGVLDSLATPEHEGWSPPGEWAVEVRDHGDLLGALSVRMPPADPMNPAKEKLVKDLAAQAGLMLRNVRLVEDLRASRQRLVAAQDEERRRLERNIHDGAQQQLVALAVKARLARQLLERDPARASDVLEQIEGDTQETLEDLRDLARGIYPPLLADAGLVAALQAQSRKAAIPIAVEAADVGRYPEEIEATVYFCTLEALQNVAKYAEADSAVVRLSKSNGTLSFAVIDEGRGFDPGAVGPGSGLQGMADRLAAVGGSFDLESSPGRGTTVGGSVPVAD